MIVGVIGAVVSAVKSRHILRWAILPIGSFGVLSLFAFFGLALPSHGFWRLAVPWNLLLLPFAAMMLVLPISLAKTLHPSRRRTAMIISTVLVLEFTMNLGRNAWSRTRVSHFTTHDLASGQFISGLLEASDGDVGVETTRWHFVHIRSASRYPDRVHPLTGGDPLRPERTFHDALERESLCGRRIEHVLLMGNRPPETGPIVREFVPWVLYAVSCDDDERESATGAAPTSE